MQQRLSNSRRLLHARVVVNQRRAGHMTDPESATPLRRDDETDGGGDDRSESESHASASANATSSECARVLANQRDYYAVLGVSRRATHAELKRAYRNLARVLHPDKCRDARATEAMAVVTSAHSTLTTPTLRAAYDLYASRFAGGDAADAPSFGEWQSKEGQATMHMPTWLVKALATPVLGQLIGLLAFAALLALGLVFLALACAYFVVHMFFWLICCFGCCGSCWPRYGIGARVHEKRQARFTEMLRDYERAATQAVERGDEPPHATVFFAQWNVDHPEPDYLEIIRLEDEAARATTTNNTAGYGSV
jgi:DnaJ-domain-containing protein 1